MLQLRVTVTDTVLGESISFEDVIDVEFQGVAQDGAWNAATNDEDKLAHKTPGFKQYAWGLGRVFFRAWRHEYGHELSRAPRPIGPPAPTGDIPTSVEP